MNTGYSAGDPEKQGSDKQTVLAVLLAFLKLGFTSFGGPVAHIGYFRHEFVEKRRWISDARFSQLLAVCQFLPGPASSQLGFSIGLLKAGWPGAVAAFIVFTAPSVVLLILFAAFLPAVSGAYGDAAIHGLKLVACVVVADAVIGMAQKLCPDIKRRIIAVSAAAILIVSGSIWMQILVVAAGAVAGLILCRDLAPVSAESVNLSYGRRTALVLSVIFTGLLIWTLFPSESHSGAVYIAEAFYRAGALVFGGGHVVLPLLEDSVVQNGWVTEAEFLAGYGASQAIPGPMFAFSAYLGALSGTGAEASLNALIAVVFMFLPGFLLIAAVLPFWQKISANEQATGAVAGINAVVVGLLAAALYDPVITSSVTSVADILIVTSAFLVMKYLKLSPLWIVGWCVTGSLVSSAI